MLLALGVGTEFGTLLGVITCFEDVVEWRLQHHLTKWYTSKWFLAGAFWVILSVRHFCLELNLGLNNESSNVYLYEVYAIQYGYVFYNWFYDRLFQFKIKWNIKLEESPLAQYNSSKYIICFWLFEVYDFESVIVYTLMFGWLRAKPEASTIFKCNF